MRDTLGMPSYFDGDSPNLLGVSFAWSGDPHESRSVMMLPDSNRWIAGGWTATQLPSRNTVPHPLGRDHWSTTLNRPRFGSWGTFVEIAPGEAREQFANTLILGPNVAEVEPLVQHYGSIATAIGYVGEYVGTSQAYINWWNDSGSFISRDYGPETSNNQSGGHPLGDYSSVITRSVVASSPANAAYATVGIRHMAPAGEDINPSARFLADMAILVVSNRPVSYFDGATPDAATFTYEWEGEPDRSPSIRVGEPLPVGSEPIIDPNCPPPPPAPLPPQLALGCASPIEEWRRVWYVIPPEEVYEWGSVLLNFTLNSGAEDVEEMRITLWPNPSGDDPFDFDDGVNYTGRWHVSYMPANSTMVINGTTRTVTTTPPDGVPRDTPDLVHGPGQGPILWPELRCGEQYLVAIDTPIGADYENIDLALELVRRFG